MSNPDGLSGLMNNPNVASMLNGAGIGGGGGSKKGSAAIDKK